MEKVLLVPKPGLLVRDPITGRALPPEGGEKPLSPYWRRRIKDGDVSRGRAKPQPAAGRRAGNQEPSKED